MKSFLTRDEDTNDLFLDGSGNLAIGEDINAVVQLVQNALNTLRGEIQLDTSLGVPYLETVFNQQSPDISLWESYMIEEAEKVDGVVRVNYIETKVKDGLLSYEMEIITDYGKEIVRG